MARIAPRLMVFTDATRAKPSILLARFEALAARAQPGSVLFTLRDYDLPLRARWALAEQLCELAERTQQAFGLAERADVARALGAAALHLPETGLHASDARSYLGPEVFLSRGSHDPEGAPEAELDAVLLSPICQARKGREALGFAALERARRRPRPTERSRGSTTPLLFALGGVDAHNAASCLAAGAVGVAVIGAALAPEPGALLAALGILRSSAWPE